jgi:hypothetical protein
MKSEEVEALMPVAQTHDLGLVRMQTQSERAQRVLGQFLELSPAGWCTDRP